MSEESAQTHKGVFDAFANRICDNTKQTLITEDGLMAMKSFFAKPPPKTAQSVATAYAVGQEVSWFVCWAVGVSLTIQGLFQSMQPLKS